MIRLVELTKVFAGGHVAVDHLDLEVDDGELCVLVGPSGCGKTTTMKMINRLIEPTSGSILLDGEDVTRSDAVALRRRIGYVIQSVGLFPHLSVADNVATVPRLLGWDPARVRDRASELLDLVGLPAATFGHRYPAQLSGGQRQRVGVARALGADPPVLLMDEPFGAIDPVTRARLQDEFLRLQRQLRKTVVFVTHDIDEAVRMGDRIAIMAEGGTLAQHGTPAEILGHPASPFVADFVGSDRGLKRLSVTGIEPADLDRPPVVGPDDDCADARLALDAQGARWAVVVDPDGRLVGWVDREACQRAGRVGDRVLALEGRVPVGATLEAALARMLTHDTGWVAVLDGERYAGVLTPDSVHAALRRSVAGGPG